jgi:hypothetical protein
MVSAIRKVAVNLIENRTGIATAPMQGKRYLGMLQTALLEELRI